MTCRQTFRWASMGKSLRFKTSLRTSSIGMQPSIYTVDALSRSPMLSAKSTAIMSASFHSSPMKMNEFVFNIQDEDDFKARVLNNSKPVIVDFFATWCGPCKLLVPRIESLEAVKNGSAILAKVDIDELPDLAVNYGVEAVPTVIAVKNGKVVDKFVGLKDDAALESFVAKLTG